MVREYWKDSESWFVFLSNDDENTDLISQLRTNVVVTYMKAGKPDSFHFRINDKQLKKLPIKTFKKVGV